MSLANQLAKELVATRVPAPAPRLGHDYAASEVGWTWLTAIAERVVELGWYPPGGADPSALPIRAELARLQADAQELEAAIDRIRQVHDQEQPGLLAPGRWCPGCGETIPCKTIRALNGGSTR